MRKTLFAVSLLFVIVLPILFSFGMFVSEASNSLGSSSNSCDFIFFSDSHVGREANLVSGSDNLSSVVRYSLLMSKLNVYETSFIACGGDCITADTMQGNEPILQDWYGEYMQVTGTSVNTLFSVRGNHDFNVTLFTEMIGPLNWIHRFGDILAVGIGSTTDNGIRWTPQTLYNTYTEQFLASAVNSDAYRQTTYHFLFMHYEPTSHYVDYTPPQSTLQYLPYFNIVFCGHNAGPTTTFLYNGVRCVHVAHLGDSTLSTDEYVTVNINRNLGKITVTAFNFWLGTQRAILT
jgi:hypothetical protein